MNKKNVFRLLAVITAMCFAATAVQATDWTNAGGDNLWQNPDNWADEEVPETSNLDVNAAAEPDDYIFIGPLAGTGYSAEWEWPDNLASVNNMRFGDHPADPEDHSVASLVIVDGATLMRDYDEAYDPDVHPEDSGRYARIFVIGESYPAVMDVSDAWILQWQNLFIGGSPQDRAGGDGMVNVDGDTYWQLQRTVIGSPTETNYGELNILGDNVLMRTNIGGVGAANQIGNNDGHGTLNMHGGYLHYGDESVSVGTNGVINLYGGTIYVESGNLNIADGGQIYFEEGHLIVAGDAGGLLDHEKMTAWGGYGQVEVEYIEDYHPHDGYPAVWEPEELPYATEGPYANVARNVTIFYAEKVDIDVAWGPNFHETELGGESTLTGIELTWNAGDTAKEVDGQDVYFGTDFDDVNNATVHTTGIYQGRQSETNYTVSANELELGTTYYWRVDQIDTDNQIHKGHIWWFSIDTTVSSLLLIDDFGSYESSGDLQEEWVPSANADVSLETDNQIYIFNEQSLSMDFNNSDSPYYSEVTKTFSTGQNWSGYGFQSLSIAYMGHQNVDMLYIGLSDGEVWDYIVLEDTDKLQGPLWPISEWHMLDFDLGWFDIDLTHVTQLTIGIGEPVSPDPAGDGTVNIGQITLHAVRCMPEYNIVSRTLDCWVGVYELEQLASDWLMQGYTSSSVEPDNNFLKAHYDFNEGSGDILTDLSGNENDATIDAQGSENWVSGGADGSGHCLYLDGSFGVSVPGSVFEDVENSFTISIWINADSVDPKAEFVEFRIESQSHPDNKSDVTVWEIADADALQGQWHHFAFIRDEHSMSIYKNGYLISQNRQVFLPLDTSEQVTRLGLGIDSSLPSFLGKIDKVHIYNYALSHDEVVYLFDSELSHIDQPLTPVLSDWDLTDENIVNLKDFSVLAELWMQQELWP